MKYRISGGGQMNPLDYTDCTTWSIELPLLTMDDMESLFEGLHAVPRLDRVEVSQLISDSLKAVSEIFCMYPHTGGTTPETMLLYGVPVYVNESLAPGEWRMIP